MANGGIIGPTNVTSRGKNTITSQTSSGTLTTQPGTRLVNTLVVGGGAGAAGSNAGGTVGGAGGVGVASGISGSSVFRGGGGGGGGNTNGGAGGNGGGGDGAKRNTNDGAAGTANTGGGGGGGAESSGYNAVSYAGGSGVVILRYPTANATISVGAGLTSSSATSGSDTIVTFTAGTGNVQFS